jgi:hypothetical protein
MIMKHVDPFAAGLMTDDAHARTASPRTEVRTPPVAHGRGEYVRGKVHTNTVEGFFSLLKRGIIGTFHHIGTEHLDKYANEFAFRYSHRNISDGARAERSSKRAKASG